MSTTLFLNADTPQSHSHPRIQTTDDAMSEANSPRNGNNPYDQEDREKIRYRRMSHQEWIRFCRGVGVFRDDESHEVIRPTCACWPSKGFRDGLYQDVLMDQSKYGYFYLLLSVSKWILLLLQIGLGSILTGLGSFATDHGIAITVIAAINTGVAGVLALLHNSGLPERCRSNRNEFKKVEAHIKSIVDTGLMPADGGVNEALAGCFERYRTARQSVENNTPAFYTPAAAAGSPGAASSSWLMAKGRGRGAY